MRMMAAMSRARRSHKARFRRRRGLPKMDPPYRHHDTEGSLLSSRLPLDPLKARRVALVLRSERLQRQQSARQSKAA